MTDLNERTWNLALQLLKILCLYYHYAYGHETSQNSDLPKRAPTLKHT